MKKQNLRSKLLLTRERVRQLTVSETLVVAGGLKITDGSNATQCLTETVPGSCQDNTAHFCSM